MRFFDPAADFRIATTRRNGKFIAFTGGNVEEHREGERGSIKGRPQVGGSSGQHRSRALAARFFLAPFIRWDACADLNSQSVEGHGFQPCQIEASGDRLQPLWRLGGRKMYRRRNCAQRLKPPPVATLFRTAETVLFHRRPSTTAFSDQSLRVLQHLHPALALASSTMGARCRGDKTAAASSSCSFPRTGHRDGT